MPLERLQKLLAHAGVASRRAAEQLILSGQVRVNGQVVTELGAKADPTCDRIEVSGTTVRREAHVHYLVHKPRGVVTTLQDPEGRPTLAELLTRIAERVYPVGRLDFHTSGALLVTNDGDLAQALLHPSRGVPKTYVAKLSLEADERMLDALRTGVLLDDGYKTRPAQVDFLRLEDGKTWLEITISEGKNRQIHRMVEAVGARVMRLSRLSFAGLTTEGLRPGQLRPLTEAELAALKREYQGVEAPAAGATVPRTVRAGTKAGVARVSTNRAARPEKTDQTFDSARASRHKTRTT
jgi:23S rRNA pseudouridine2605 synthase